VELERAIVAHTIFERLVKEGRADAVRSWPDDTWPGRVARLIPLALRLRTCLSRKEIPSGTIAAVSNPLMIGIRFDIGKAGEGYYGLTCWSVFWRAIHPADLGPASLFDGDTAATLRREENVFCIVVQDLQPEAVRAIKGALDRQTEFKRLCANPMFVEGAACGTEVLSEVGAIDSAGNLSGRAGASRSAFEAVSKAGSLAKRGASRSSDDLNGRRMGKAKRTMHTPGSDFPQLWRTVTLGLFPKSDDYLRELQTPPFDVFGFNDMPGMIRAVPISRRRIEVKLALGSLRQLGFIWSASVQPGDIIKAARERGLDLCPPEAALALRLACRGPENVGSHQDDLPIAMENVRVRSGLWFNRRWRNYGVFKLGKYYDGKGRLVLWQSDDWEPRIAHQHDRLVVFRILE
jgi:hypothetical protein